MPKAFKIGNSVVGESKTYVIAEAGSNHNGDLSLAKALIEEAAKAGADAVKFQAFKASHHYSKHTPNFTYLDKIENQKSTYELIRALEINREWHPILKEYAQQCGITFLSSPCDSAAVQELGRLGMAAFKVASFDLPDLELIREIAEFQKPVILSTGMANYHDIQSALQVCADAKNDQVVLLQCTSLYPAPASLSNLRAIATLREAFDVPVGYSDHTLGDHIILASVALGACMIEKHFTLDRSLPGPDHGFAMEPQEFSEMVRKIREIESAQGDGIKNGPRALEREMYEKGRRSLHSKKALGAGEVLRREDLCIKRPGYGISPHLIHAVVGLTLTRDVLEDHWISWEDFK